MRVVSHASTHVGRRSNNEDSWSAVDRFGLYIVADGMGGYEGGEIASRTVVDTITKYFARMTPSGELGLGDSNDDYALARGRMDLALRIAHREICRKKVGELQRMGSTVAALVVQRGRALIAHVGDSRIYRLRGGRLERMTRDHSLYAEMEATGRVSLPPRQQCSYQHVITRALGAAGDSRPDLRVEEALPGDLFVLATDGLTDVISDEAIASWARKEDPCVLAARLVDAAWQNDAQDNITVVAVAVE
ncbi:MAG: protein phosphatase 2C domain-containing protein [Myxococcota bacterium]|nr:protein phosphatase 2C domain-containing protein [Myxococcota bacterium]